MKALNNAELNGSVYAAGPDSPGRGFFALIDNRRLERECFVRSIALLQPELTLVGYSTTDEFAAALQSLPRPRTILFSVGNRQLSNPEVMSELDVLLKLADPDPVIVVAPSDDLDEMIAAYDAGATGYIPASVGMEEIMEVAKLAASGGVFLKFETLAKFRGTNGPTKSPSPELQNLTGRQAAVAEALRRGKANKTIAYELGMCESTVKVHIRSIMRKLSARNRTEAAFKLNSVLPAAADVD